VLLDAFIGSTISILNSNHFDTGLTIPTLILMACIPVKQAFQRMPALVFLLIFLLCVFAGLTISPIGVSAFLTYWVILLDFLAVSVLTILLLTTRQRLLRIIDFILLPSTFVAVYGIYGYITKQYGTFDTETSLFRSYSIFSAAPAPALFLSIIIPITIYRATTLQGLKRFGLIILILIFLVGIGVTFTRSAFISVPLSVLIMVFLLPSRKLKVGIFSSTLALIGIIFVTVSNIPIFSRFFNQDFSTFNGRTYLWQALLSHFDPTKLLGNGHGASDALLMNLGLGNISSSPSNLFLGTLYDHGIIGLIILLLIFITLAISLIKGILNTTGERRTLFTVALATFINMFLQSFDANDLWAQTIGLYFWVIMALPFALCWLIPEQIHPDDAEIFDRPTELQLEVVRSVKLER
jgi:O-antigen ligase